MLVGHPTPAIGTHLIVNVVPADAPPGVLTTITVAVPLAARFALGTVASTSVELTKLVDSC